MWTRQAKYDDAVSKGESAFMLSSASGAGPDVFKVSLGNLQPGQDVAISFTYVSELARSDGPRGVSWRTVLPTVLVPAFSVAPQPFSAAALPEVRSAVTSAGATGYSMTVRWSASMSAAITSIESPSHPAPFAGEGVSASALRAAVGTMRASMSKVEAHRSGCPPDYCDFACAQQRDGTLQVRGLRGRRGIRLFSWAKCSRLSVPRTVPASTQ